MAISFITSSTYIGVNQEIRFDRDSVDRTLTATIGSYSYTASLSPTITQAIIPIPLTVINQIGGATNGTLRVSITGTNAQNGTKKLYVPPAEIANFTQAVILGDTTEAVVFNNQALSLKYKVFYAWNGQRYYPSGSSYIQPTNLGNITVNGTAPIAWANQLIDAMSATFTITLITYTSANAEVGRSSRTATFIIPSYSITASFTEAPQSDVGFGATRYIQTLSKVLGIAYDVSYPYNARESAFTMEVDGATYSWRSSSETLVITSKALKSSGELPVKYTLTDTRGQTKTATNTIYVIPYFKPTVAVMPSVSGTNVTVEITGKVAPVIDHDSDAATYLTALNYATITVTRTKVKTGETETVVPTQPLIDRGDPEADYDYTFSFFETVADADVDSYEYTATVEDHLYSTTASRSTGVICISRLAGGLGVRFFAEAEAEGVWIRNIDYTISDTEFIALATELAETYNTATSYEIGDYCLRNSTLYRCKTATTGTWTASNWEAIT